VEVSITLLPSWIKFIPCQRKRCEHMEVKVIRSPDRKKTIQAKIVGETLVVYLPLGMHREEERKLIEKMKQKIERKRLKNQINKDDYLRKRFDEFNDKYFQGKLRMNSIEFVTNQERNRGSCTPAKGTIRISHKLLNMPRWVLDYVIIHEMTHLLQPDHSRAFWAKVGEYKYTERARGFLMAKGMDENEDETESNGGDA
jgi:predicted metal-dependent hydrolase